MSVIVDDDKDQPQTYSPSNLDRIEALSSLWSRWSQYLHGSLPGTQAQADKLRHGLPDEVPWIRPDQVISGSEA